MPERHHLSLLWMRPPRVKPKSMQHKSHQQGTRYDFLSISQVESYHFPQILTLHQLFISWYQQPWLKLTNTFAVKELLVQLLVGGSRLGTALSLVESAEVPTGRLLACLLLSLLWLWLWYVVEAGRWGVSSWFLIQSSLDFQALVSFKHICNVNVYIIYQ